MKRIFAILTVLLIAGCSASQVADRYPLVDIPLKQDQNVLAEQASTSTVQRVIQYSATINMDTDTPDTLFKKVLELTGKNEGYLLKSEKDRITVRIPTQQFSAFLNALSGFGKVVSKDIQGTDVTEEYYDLTTRLDNAQKTRQRYLELLNRAQSVESALAVERELERLNRDIDMLSGRINRLKHLADFSTITITTTAPVRPGPIGYVFYAAYVAVKWLFVWN